MKSINAIIYKYAMSSNEMKYKKYISPLARENQPQKGRPGAKAQQWLSWQPMAHQ